jgi:hypothetical protein
VEVEEDLVAAVSAEVTPAVVVEASTVVEVSAVAVSTAVAFVVAALVASAEVESASAEHTSPVEFRTLLAQDRASLHLGILHLGSLSLMDELADPYLRPLAQQQRLIGQPSLQRRVHLEQLHSAD